MKMTVDRKQEDVSFDRAIYLISKWFDMLGWVSISAMVFLAVLNVVLRIVGKPMQGAIELTSFLSALIMGFGLTYSIITGGHVSVQILTSRLRGPTQVITNIISNILTLLALTIMFWGTCSLTIATWGEKSVILKIFYAPFIAVISICCLLSCLAVFADILKLLTKTPIGSK